MKLKPGSQTLYDKLARQWIKPILLLLGSLSSSCPTSSLVSTWMAAGKPSWYV